MDLSLSGTSGLIPPRIKCWSFEKVGCNVYILMGDQRMVTVELGNVVRELGPVLDIVCADGDAIRLKVEGLEFRKKFNWTLFDDGKNLFSRLFYGCQNKRDFIEILTSNSDIIRGRPRGKKRKTSVASTSLISVGEDSFIDINKRIEKAFIGSFEIKVDRIKPAPENLQPRDMYPLHVQNLKRALLTGPKGTQTLLPAHTDEETFDPEMSDFYILGGNHLVEAISQLVREHKDRPDIVQRLMTVSMNVYRGLTPDEQRILANSHNAKSAFKPPTFLDYAKQARKLLFELAELDIFTDEPPANSPKGFREKFSSQMNLGSATKVTSDAYSTEYFAAKMSRRCWESLVNLNMERANGLVNEPEVTKKHVQKFQGLDEESIYNLFNQVKHSDGRAGYTFAEIAARANQYKRLPCLKECAERLLGLEWTNIMTVYPESMKTAIILPYAEDFPTAKNGISKLREDFIVPPRFRNFINMLPSNDQPDSQTSQELQSSQVKVRVQVDGKLMNAEESREIQQVVLKYLNEKRKNADYICKESTPKRARGDNTNNSGSILTDLSNITNVLLGSNYDDSF